MNTTTKVEQLALAPIERAALALGAAEHEVQLRELAQASCRILTITNVDAREEAHRAGMSLRSARTNLTAKGKEARDDANAFSKAVIAEEKRLIAIIEPEEKRVLALRDEFDAKIEAERQAAIAAERRRVEAIQADIASIHDVVLGVVGKPADVISAALAQLEEIDATEARFAEFHQDAAKVIGETTDKLAELHAGAVATEKAAAEAEAARLAEAERVANERAELARLRAEADERARLAQIETDRIAAEQAAEAKRLADMKSQQEAEALAARERVAAESKRQLEAQQAQLAAESRAIEEERAQLERERNPVPVPAASPAVIEQMSAPVLDPAADWPTPEVPAQATLTDLADAQDDGALFPTDGELVAEIRRHFSEVFGMSQDETDTRMRQFDYAAALAEVAA